MASGKQLAEENFRTFSAWRASKTDSDFCQMVYRGGLNRVEIAKECEFSKSALLQNPRICEALKELEQDLRQRGVLPSLAVIVDDGSANVVPLLREPGKQKAAIEHERLRRLELENAALRNENLELKRQLERFTQIQRALSLTGRILR